VTGWEAGAEAEVGVGQDCEEEVEAGGKEHR